MKKPSQQLVAWLTVLSLLFAMMAPAMAASTVIASDTAQSNTHSTHAQTTAVEQSPCCDHDCHCETMASNCADGSCECAIGGSSGTTQTFVQTTLSINHGDNPQHARFAIVTCSTQPDIPPPSFS